ncbi:protein of unknown function [Magnetospirillum gryphiswaldense MSR-1 v2]|uniref:Uncharacterized protein n=1 Tax=Magnetospirillum gryphiswaldense (strain DSM 6361 / JCM 21280 / NBRC 15271 / MSR-1) TaxID=431944 RepID=V6F2L1_MAGGM|nr:protein of unknown function [Magnetospirillum gryphiswaldense MSR-1 v2]
MPRITEKTTSNSRMFAHFRLSGSAMVKRRKSRICGTSRCRVALIRFETLVSNVLLSRGCWLIPPSIALLDVTAGRDSVPTLPPPSAIFPHPFGLPHLIGWCKCRRMFGHDLPQ